jgi:hypothetical protein
MSAKCMVFLCAMAVFTPAVAQPADGGNYAVGAEQVAQALARGGIHVTAGQVTMVADVVASRPRPQLEVLAVGPPAVTAASGIRPSSWIMLGCSVPGICLPFYVLIAKAVGESPRQSRVGAYPKAVPKKSAILIRAGARATLVLAGPKAQIELSVVSLEAGAMGRIIRVATPDYKQFYRAQVMGANWLKGTF